MEQIVDLEDKLITLHDKCGEAAVKVSAKFQRKKSTPFNRNLVLSKPIRSSWKQKMQLKIENRNIKAIEQSIKAEKRAEIEERKRKRIEKQKRKEENVRKAEIVQQIKNLKKITKKGVKRIRKI